MTEYLEPISLSFDEQRALQSAAPRHDAYRFLDLPVTIHSNSPEILAFFRKLYGRFLIEREQVPEDAHSYYVLAHGVHPRGSLLLWDKDRACILQDNGGLADSADIVILGSVLRKNLGYFLIHGAALCLEGRGVVLAGMSGSGKSTLALELARRGLSFFSDEIAAISRETNLMHPFPRGIGAREGTSELIPGLDLRHGKLHETASGEKKRIVDIMDLCSAPVPGTCRGKCLILLDTDAEQWAKGEQGFHDVRVALKYADPALLRDLSALEGVEHLSSDSLGTFTAVDFRIAKSKAVQRMFLDVCRGYDDAIVYRVKVVARPPDPDREPELLSIPKVQAGLEVLGNLQNVVANDGWMSTDASQSSTATLYELLGPLGEMDCYRLLVGNLRKTADLVVSLLE
jgi:hypothetical protein